MFPVGNKSVFEDVADTDKLWNFLYQRKLKKRQKGSIYEVD
jgi:hypothetical protein